MFSLEFLNPNSKFCSSLGQIKPTTACAMAGVAAIITGVILTLALNQVLPHGVNVISNMGTGGAVLSYGILAAGGGLAALVLGQVIKKKVDSGREKQKEQENSISEEQIAAYLKISLNAIPVLERIPTIQDFRDLKSNIIRGTFEGQKFIAIAMHSYYEQGLLILKSPENENRWTEHQLEEERGDNPHYFMSELDLNDSDFLTKIIQLETMLHYKVGFPDNKNKVWYVGRNLV